MTLFRGKKGMEMWEIVLIIIALILLIFMIVWYGSQGSMLDSLFGKLGNLL